jgi:hypothetical protein
VADLGQPLETLREGIGEVRSLLELEGGLTSKVTVQKNAILRAGVVLLVSHFESFLKSIAEEFADSIDGAQVKASALPDEIRELYSVPMLQQISSTNDDTQRRALLKKMAPVVALWNDGATVGPGTLRAKPLVRVVTNCGSDVINELFRLMGGSQNVCDGDIDVIDRESGEKKAPNIKLSLRDIVDCRNDIAHYGLERKPTRGDVLRYIRFLEAFSERLDLKAHELLGSIVSTSVHAAGS